MLLLFLLTFFSSVPNIYASCDSDACPCPDIQFIDQSGIQNLEYGSYLANRTTTRPNVTVTDSCQIFADVSALETDNHFLMVFRDGAPPIFMKRLSSSTDKTIQLSDITCDTVSNQWMYYNGIVNNLSVVVQANEEQCDCTYNLTHPFDPDISYNNLTTCDTFASQCRPGSGWLPTLSSYGSSFFYFGATANNSLVIEDMTCVSGSWYHNSAAIQPYLLCDKVEMSACGCVNFSPINSWFDYTMAEDGRFADYTLTQPSVNYTDCSAEITCAADETLAIFSPNFETLVYPPGTKASAICANSPLATSPSSPSYWFIDGVMLTNPYFGCYAKSCPCPFAFLTGGYIQNFVGSHPAYENVTSGAYRLSKPSFSSDFVDHCPVEMHCIYVNSYLVNFDNETADWYPEEGLRISCSPSTGKWTLNGTKVVDRFYGICATVLNP